MLKYKQFRIYIFILYISSLCYSQFINPFSTSVLEEKLKDKGIDDTKINKMLQEGVQGKSNNISPSGSQSSGNTMNPPNSNDIINVEKIKKEIMDQVGPVGPRVNNITKVTKKSSPSDPNEVSVEDQLLIKKNTLDKIKEKRSKQIDKTLDSGKQKEKFFGYNIFSDNSFIDTDTYNQYETIDPNYLIGPGDEIILMLWGETELFNSFVISKEGFLFIPNIGQVFVNGLTLEKLEKKLLKLLKKSYSSLDPESGGAKTFFDLSLGSTALRPIKVTILGEVDNPGENYFKSSLSFFNSVFSFGGPKISGSLRNIILIRNDKEIGSIDLYGYILSGKRGKDFRLQRDDVIFIPTRGKTVVVKGKIKRTNLTYELKENEGLKELIDFAGGVTTRTYLKRVQIKRTLTPEKRSEIGYNSTYIDLDISSFLDSDEKIDLYDGDIIEFFSVDDVAENYVTISGAVKIPGKYSIGEGLLIGDLIQKAGGIEERTYLDRLDIERQHKDYTKTQITLNLGKILNGDKTQNISLQSFDRIEIYDRTRWRNSKSVSIVGHVKNPGRVNLIKNMTIADLLFKGGGFLNKRHKELTYFDRAELSRLNDNGFSKRIIPFRLDSALMGNKFSEGLLKDQDEIRIYSLDEVTGLSNKNVEISGFVKRPGSYRLFDENMTIYDLLFSAGGMEDTLHLSRTYLKRADLTRFDKNYKTTDIIRFNLGEIIQNKNSDINYKLRAGDKIRVYSTEDFNMSKSVTIDGIIKSPGSFTLSENSNLKDLILQAGGVTENVFRYRAELARIDPKSDDETFYAEIFTIDLNNDLSVFQWSSNANDNLSKGDFKLMPFDLVTLRPDPNFSLQRKVTITGSVYYPGAYVIRSPYEKVSDIIERAGGLKPEAYPKASSLQRNGQEIQLSFEKIIKYPSTKFNFEVMAGDVLNIGEKTKLVVVNGSVNSPGNYQYIKGYRFNDYIELAGGYSRDAARLSSFVTYPDGTANKIKLLKRSPKIEDGAVIMVGTKRQLQIDYTTYLTNVTALLTQLSQSLLLISLAFRQ